MKNNQARPVNRQEESGLEVDLHGRTPRQNQVKEAIGLHSIGTRPSRNHRKRERKPLPEPMVSGHSQVPRTRMLPWDCTHVLARVPSSTTPSLPSLASSILCILLSPLPALTVHSMEPSRLTLF